MKVFVMFVNEFKPLFQLYSLGAIPISLLVAEQKDDYAMRYNASKYFLTLQNRFYPVI